MTSIRLSTADFQRQLEAALFDREQRGLLGALKRDAPVPDTGPAARACQGAAPVQREARGAAAGWPLAAGLLIAAGVAGLGAAAGLGGILPVLPLALAALLMLLLAVEGGGPLFGLLAMANLAMTAALLHGAPVGGGVLPLALLHWLVAALALLDADPRAPLLRVWLGVEVVSLALAAWSLQ